MREVIVWESVHNAVWQRLEKELYDAVFDRLIDQLQKHYDRWRKRRHPEDNSLFVYTLSLAEKVNWHTFEFVVDDTMADTALFVVGVTYQPGKIGI